MLSFPNAKINIGLNVVEKRSDGYHNLETIFYPIHIKDCLEILDTDQDVTTLNVVGIDISGDQEQNLVVKAFRFLQNLYDLPEQKIVLQKNIPIGAGLGGGSADAAFMLKLVNEKFNLNVSLEKLAEYAKTLGADCPFFIYNKPMYAEGIGDVFSAVDIDLSNYRIEVVKPDIHVSTADAFRNVKPSSWQMPLKEAIKQPIEQWKNLVFNDFEKSIFTKFPEIEKVKQQLYNNGAVYASLSGSGSALFGIFNK